MPKKIAFCVGINEYAPGSGVSRLDGCVNDALLIGEMLKYAGFNMVRQAHNSTATQDGILRRLDHEISKLKAGDHFVFWNSSHGYQVRDRDGDELLDNLDEAVCVYDTNPRNPLTDDKLAKALGKAPDGAKIFFGSDSCHSGSVCENGPVGIIGSEKGGVSKPKSWTPPEDIRFRRGEPLINLNDYVKGMRPSAKPSKELALRRFGMFTEKPASIKYLFLAACRSDQLSWDSRFPQGYHGALTYNFAMAVMKSWGLGKAITYREAFNKAVNGLQRQQFHQTPQLDGPDNFKDSPVFGFVPAKKKRRG